MAAQPHRVALLGAGGFATGAHLPAIASTRSLSLVAVYSRSRRSVESLVQAAQKYSSIAANAELGIRGIYCDEDGPEQGLDALLKREDIETVVLALPIAAQPAIIEKAWRAGKSVISEKPIAPSIAEARRLISLSSSASLPPLSGTGSSTSSTRPRWFIAEQFPFTPAFDRAARLVRAGRIGRMRSFNAEIYIQVPKPEGEQNWRKVPDYQGGFLLDGGVHFAAALRHVLPSPILSISASVRQLQPYLPPIDTLQALVTCEDGTTGTLTLSFGLERPSGEKRYVFRGEKGTVEVDFADPRTHVVRLVTVPDPREDDEDDDGCSGPQEPHRMEMEFPAQIGVENEFEAFGKVLSGDETATADVLNRAGSKATLRDLAFIEAAIKSSEEKREISLRELIGEEDWNL
ncbi:hypothetical protein JCM10908_005720 [Rhodotorula pacifica]|uniref:Gfo/Idh/MocA family protein n=1 Tax=Rhodotorula pacifica TaxID=1495444 RepID=UPI00316CA874